ncbi:hypothetical protein B566_EDAN007951 [Ephemera danica]|nr:hypothetical protein B566_EDAN007951 [Ephemera danica]
MVVIIVECKVARSRSGVECSRRHAHTATVLLQAPAGGQTGQHLNSEQQTGASEAEALNFFSQVGAIGPGGELSMEEVRMRRNAVSTAIDPLRNFEVETSARTRHFTVPLASDRVDLELLPYLALLDPRTGENLHHWGGTGDPVDVLRFAAYLRAFIEVNGQVNRFNPPIEVPESLVQNHYEIEPDLQLAIQASVAQQPTPGYEDSE